MTAIERESSGMHVGYQKRVVVGTQRGPATDTTVVREMNLGTMCSVTPRVLDDHTIDVEVRFARSALSDVEHAAPTAATDPSSVVTVQTRSHVLLNDGNAETIVLTKTQADGNEPTTLLVIGAHTRAKAEAQSKREPVANPSGPPQLDMDTRYRSYVNSLIRRYDQNNDGILEQSEWKTMRRDPSQGDRNSDGEMDAEELLEWLRSISSR